MPRDDERRSSIYVLFCASFTALLLELALIRWLASEVRVVAYFPNLVLIASFLGLGTGALTKFRSSWLIGLGVLVVVLVATALGQIAFTSSGASEHLWLLYFDLPRTAPVVNSVVFPIALVFILVTLAFIPIGGVISACLESFRQEGRTLAGYALDLAGSLAGVIVFLIASAAGTRPIWWFGGVLVIATAFVPRRLRLVHALFAAGVLAVICVTDHADFYSPYYSIQVLNGPSTSVIVLTNRSIHQQAIDLRQKSGSPSNANLERIRRGYRFPVDQLAHKPRRALVLGAGTGNDVAVLLDAGVPEVHAVEIDPVILEIGRTRHPSDPYHDPRVIVHNTDGRAFLETTDLKFDLIVFGTLDSMTRLSALGNVRLDNFVYTVESIQAAKARLTPEGGLALLFMVGAPQIDEHLYAILRTAFGEPPLVSTENRTLFNRIYLAGPGFAHLRGDPALHMGYLEAAGDHVTAPTDNWPYLYLTSTTIPSYYFGLVAVILGTAATLLFTASKPLRLEVMSGQVDLEMMLFGAAFLLVETSFVTEMNLLFGATWRTSAIVFASLLVALLIATLTADRRSVSTRLALTGVIAALCFVAYLPLRSIAPTGEFSRVLFALAVCGLPVFCSGLAFAARFAERPRADTAFGWNIMGAVVGGLLEFSSMTLGLHALFLIAAILYAVVLLLAVKRFPTLAIAE